MKTLVLCVVAYVLCNVDAGRRVLPPLDKNANLDFISMEGGARPGPATAVKPAPAPVKPAQKPGKPIAIDPTSLQAESVRPVDPIKTDPKPLKPVVITEWKPPVYPTPTPPPKHVMPQPVPAKPTTPPRSPAAAVPPHTSQTFPQGPQPGSRPVTPGPGSVQQLINYYDSRGQASPIRPYTYSQAVKQGKPN